MFNLDGTESLLDAFDEAVRASEHVMEVDRALVAAGRAIADRVDTARRDGEGQEVTKALYLVPHMVNILRELLATPASRQNAGLNGSDAKDGKLAALRLAGGGAKRPS